VLLVALVLAAFVPCLGNEFLTWDDEENFLENPYFRGLGWPQFRWAWTSYRVGVYQPLSWIILEAQYVLCDLRPWGYHLTSVVLFALDTLILFVLTLTLLVRCRPPQDSQDTRGLVPAAALAVALFAVHPLRTEVVAWVSCQPYLPCASFLMLAVLAYLRAFPADAGPDTASRTGWLVGTFVLFVAALLSKAVAVSLPALLLILDVYPLRRLGGGPGRWFGPAARRIWLEKLPFFAMSLVFMGLAVAGRVQVKHLVSVEQSGFGARVAQACYGIGFYLIKTLVPANLTACYPTPVPLIWYEPTFLLSIIAVAGVSATLFLMRRRWPALLAVWLSYLAILAPNLGLIQIGLQIAADRYSFVAMIGGVALLAAGLSWLWREGERRWPATPWVLTGICGGAILGLIVLSRGQCRTWRTSEALWTHVLNHGGSRSFMPYNNLGTLRYRQNRLAEAAAYYSEALRLNPSTPDPHNNYGAVLSRQGRLDEAMAEYSRALQIDPDYAKTHHNMGVALAKLGRTEEAREQFAEALRLDPDLADSHNNLGMLLSKEGRLEEASRHFSEALRIKPGLLDAYINLGNTFYSQGRVDEALGHYAEALRIDPGFAKAHHNLGLVYAAQGRLEKAKEQLAEALRLDPGMADTHDSLGLILAKEGRLEEARSHFAEALRIKPRHVDAHTNMGNTLFSQGHADEALGHYAEALRIDPGSAKAHNNLGLVHAAQGRLEEARAEFAEALRLDPRPFDVHRNLGSVLARLGRIAEAMDEYAEALRINPDDPGVHNNRAMIWAAAPEAKDRDGRRAVEAATRACTLTDWKDPGLLDSLAAAYAESGAFEAAVKWQTRAIEMLTDEQRKRNFQSRLELYQAGRPYREAIAGQ
jgi:tetratricopeptide (TPR) repeat protein